MRRITLPGCGIAVIVAVLLTSSCSTVNNLAYYDLDGASISLDMMMPPEPTVNVDYSMPYSSNNHFVTFIQLGVNLIKVGEAESAREKLVRALAYTDIPGIISERLIDDIAYTLDARVVDHKRNADVLLELEILEYGIEAVSGSGGVEMFMRLQVCLFSEYDQDIVWQRRISVSEEITPGLFGFNEVFGNVVTIAGMKSLSEEQLAQGFERMAREITRKTARKLQDDLRKARHG